MQNQALNFRSSMRPNRRKHYFINRRLQGRFTLVFLLFGLAVAFGTSTLIWHFSYAELEKNIYRSHVPPIGPWEAVFPIIAKGIVISITVLIISTYLLTRLIFRRMVKRLIPFNAAIKNIGEGNLKTEVPEGMIDDINETLNVVRESLKEKISALHNLKREMEVTVTKNDTLSAEKIKKELINPGNTFRKVLSELGYNKKQ